MTTLFTATYLVNRNLQEPPGAGDVARAFFEARQVIGPDAFPYDGADDPAFFCARHFDAPVTWGVCRTDVRNQVAPGDWVAFFSGERLATGDGQDIDYRFVGVLQVASRHSGRNPPAQFDGYLNRLVAREDGHWAHKEPALSRRDWHLDWLWRLSSSPFGGKQQYEALGASGAVTDGYWSDEAADGRNYVVFDRAAGFVLERPPLVAMKRGAEELQESWLEVPEVQTLRAAVFGAEAERWLRTTNRQQPHRHTRRQLSDEAEWFEGVRAAAGALM